MKSKLLLWLLLLCSGSAWAQTVTFAQENFETDGDGGGRYTSTTATNTVSATRYFIRSQNNVPGFGNPAGSVAMANVSLTYFWACEGVRGTSLGSSSTTTPGTVTLNPISNTQNYTNLRVTIAAGSARDATTNVAATDHLRVNYRYGTTGSFTMAGEFTRDPAFASTGDPSPWTRVGGSGPAALPTAAFADYVFDVPAGAGDLYVQIEADYYGSNKEIAFDNIRVTGTVSSVPKPTIVSNNGTGTLTFAEGTATPLPIFPSLTLANPAMSSNPTLSGATVSIATGYAGTEDVLTYTIPTGSGITLASNTGQVLTFSGTASVANYETLLESVKYQDTEVNNATAGDRKLSFLVKSTVDSAPLERIITVTTALNAASPLNYTENFDTNGEGTRYGSNTRVANNQGFVRLTNASGGSATPGSGFTDGTIVTFTNVQGPGYWYANGTNTIVAGNVGVVTLAPVNSAGFVNLHFKVKAGATNNFITSEFLRFSYRASGGAWTVFANFTAPISSSPLYLNGNTSTPPLTTVLADLDFTLPASLAGTTIEFRAEALNAGSRQLVFDNIQITGTPLAAPTVTTGTASSLTPTTATISGNTLTADGGATISDYGVVYVAGAGTPTTANSKVQVGTTSPGTFPTTFSANLVGLTAGTQYTARAYATNSVGTSYGAAISFTTLTPVGGTTVVTNVSCFGGSTGAINLTPSGGVGPYTFLWSPGGQTTEDRTGLAAGTYSVTITDANGATGTVSATVTQPASAIAASTSQINIACNGGTTGAASVSPGGGTSPYTYRWSTGATTQAVTGLAAGSYSVVITDANSCTRTYSFTITQPSALTATTSQTNVTTSGGTNGSATITVSGGTPSYTYAWSPNVSTSATAANLSAGTYSVTATDANGCTIARSFTITQPAFAATAQPVTVQLDAFGNGTLNASSVNNGSTGSGTLTYTIQKVAFGYISESTTPLTLTTPNGANFTQIRFASYGTPNTTNGNYSLGSCNAANSLAAAQNAYVGRSSGSLYASNTDTRNNPVLGDPCGGTPKVLAVQAGYSADAASLTYNCTEAGQTQYVLLTVTNGTSTSTSVAQVTVNAPPTATLSSVSPTTAQRGATVTVAGTNLSGVSSVTVNGAAATVSNLTSTGFTFVVPNTATFGPGSISVATPCAQTLTNTFSVTAPALTATVSTTSTSPTSTAPIPFSVTFSQSVGTTFIASDVTVTNGTVTSGSLSGSGAGPYTFTVTPTGSGTVSVSLAAGVATDANTTANTASNTVSVQYNQPATAAPVVTTPANNSFSNNRLVTVAGTAPANSTVTIYIGTANVGSTQALTTGAFSYTILGNAPDGTYVVSATAQSSGATVSPSSNANTFTIDGTAPTAALSSATVASGSTTSTTPVSFTATFSEPVTGFTAAGLAVSNGTVTSGPTAGANNTYTFQVTPSGAGVVQAKVLANAVQDRAGNNNATSGIYAFTFAAPTITVAPASLASGVQGQAYSQLFSASGGSGSYTYALSGSLPAGLNFSGNTLSGTPTVSGSFTFRVTATDNSAAPGPYSGFSNYTLTIAPPPVSAAPVLTSPANNSTTSGRPTYAGTAPAGSTVAIYVAAGSGAAQLVGTTTATNGSFSLASPTALASGTYLVYATAQSSGATVSANSNTNTFTVDATAPLVIFSNRQSPAAAATNATTLTFRVTFSESVTGVDGSDFALTTTAGAVSSSGRTVAAISGSVYEVTVSGVTGNGTVRLDLNASGTGIIDAVGNAIGGGGYTSGQDYTLDQLAPTATISTTASSPTSISPIPFTVTFSEPVTGFSASGITVTNGTVSSALTSNGNTYSFTVTPAASGVVTVSVLANVAQDAVGNGNLAASPLSVTYAQPIPAPTITSLNPATGPVGTQVTITGTNLSGTTAVSFNGTAASSFVVNSATSITAVVAAGTTTGLVTVTTPGGTATSPYNFVVRVAPITVADSYTTPAGVTLTGNVLTNDIGTNPRAILITRTSNGTLSLNPNGSFSYVPNPGFTGTDSFTYYACDQGTPLVCGNPATVTITVTGSGPITVADTYSTLVNTLLTGNVLTNDIGTNLRAILITRPTRGTLALNPDGSFSYQPAAGYTGTDSFTYYACNMGSPLVCGNPATVTITIGAVATRVAATAPSGTSLLSGATVTQSAAALAQEVVLTGSPNPFSEQLYLTFALPTTQAYTLAIYDGQGRLVQQLARGQAEAGHAQQVAVPTHTYAAGLYLVRLTTATSTQQLKLIKQ